MLNRFRKSADNFFVRALLGLMALSFVGFGGVSYINRINYGDIVTFKSAESISYDEFLRVRSELLSRIGREQFANITEQELETRGINQFVLNNLIQNHMMQYLAKIYEMNISDDKLAEIIKNLPVFKDEKGAFNAQLFQNAFMNSPLQRQKYITTQKQETLQEMTLGGFTKTFRAPKIMQANLLSYKVQYRTADIYVFDLDKAVVIDMSLSNQIKPEQIEQFYKEHIDDFTLQETRQFSYIKLDKKVLGKLVAISAAEVDEYLSQNKDQFSEKITQQVKNQVRDMLLTEKLQEQLSTIARTIEDEISAGMSLQDLVQKYSVSVIGQKAISLAEMRVSSKKDHLNMVDMIFEMSQDEISYPIEVADENAIIIAKLEQITPTRRQELKEVQDQVIASILKQQALEAYMHKLASSHKDFASDNEASKNVVLGLANEVKKSVKIKVDEAKNSAMPPVLLEQIFTAPLYGKTPLMRQDNKIYFAYITEVKMDNAKYAQEKKHSGRYLENVMNEILGNEIVDYLARINKISIKQVNVAKE
jgi:hypothetical protein